jgi:putative serine protease PepD
VGGQSPLVSGLVPFDDDAEADHPGFRPPPHPDDRLWRHPSEMRDHPIVPVGARGRRTPPAPVPPTDSGRARRRRWVAPAVAATAGAVVAGVGVVALGIGERVVERPVTERVAVDPGVSALDAPSSSSGSPSPSIGVGGGDSQVVPAVVSVEAAGPSTDGGSTAGRAQGTGVVVRDDGIVVTSAALVVAGAAPRVRVPDGTEIAADVVGTDATTGLAVLDLEGGGYSPSVLGTEGDLVAGEASFAVSAPPSGGTATGAGVVGPARRYIGPTGSALDGVEIEGAADTPALGGPVVDDRGAVVGVTTAVEPGDAWYMVPLDVVQRVTDELLTTGVARHCWLGVEGTDAVAPDGASDSSTGAGTLVASVVPDSPAAVGGLQVGDRIVALDGAEIADMAALIVALRAYAPGDRADVTVEREDGSQVTLVIRLRAAPATSPTA